MARYRDEVRIGTAAEALDAHMRVDGLKKLAGLLSSAALPTRKAELAELVGGHLEGERLRALWGRLDELQQAAVAEVVHAPGTRFDRERFRAKYGRDPDWGSIDGFNRAAKPSLLHLFFYGPSVMPDDLKERLSAFLPEPPAPGLETTEELPPSFKRSFKRYDAAAKRMERGTAAIPLVVRETEREAQCDLKAVLRLVEAGRGAGGEENRPAPPAAPEG